MIETVQHYRFTLTHAEAEELNDLLTHCYEVCSTCPSHIMCFNESKSTLTKLRDELQRHLP